MFAFPAYHKETRKVNLFQDDFDNLCIQAFTFLKWHYKSTRFNHFEAESPATFWSYGEKITVELLDGGNLYVKSNCIMPTQCFDLGTNKKNVEAVFTEFDQLIKSYNRAPENAFSTKEQKIINLAFQHGYIDNNGIRSIIEKQKVDQAMGIKNNVTDYLLDENIDREQIEQLIKSINN